MDTAKNSTIRENTRLGMTVGQRVRRLAKALVVATLCSVVQTRSQAGNEVPRPHDASFGSLAGLAPV